MCDYASVEVCWLILAVLNASLYTSKPVQYLLETLFLGISSLAACLKGSEQKKKVINQFCSWKQMVGFPQLMRKQFERIYAQKS